MKKLFLAFALLSLAASARADIADNGNLTIGSNAIIAGTMTVQGAAFSVGGGSLAVTGGNVGVGTANPAYALDVNGGAMVRSSSTWAGVSVPPVSASGQGAIYFDSTSNKFMQSQNGSTYLPLGGQTAGGWTEGGGLVVLSTPTDNVVIKTTLTVQGSAFSVGGSTLSVAQGTTTFGGLIQASSLGVKWADGSTSTTAASGGGLPAVSTRQTFTSGSGTYTTPAGARQLKIRMIGGGGGGGGGSSGTGTGGNASSFAGVVASSGAAGAAHAGDPGSGGTGGTNGSVSGVIRIPGAGGSCGYINDSGAGGSGALGGGARGRGPTSSTGAAGGTNSGSGGGGGINSSGTSGCGAGAGEYVEFILNSPAGSYIYVVAGTAAGASGGDATGGQGAAGIIIVDEFY